MARWSTLARLTRTAETTTKVFEHEVYCHVHRFCRFRTEAETTGSWPAVSAPQLNNDKWCMLNKRRRSKETHMGAWPQTLPDRKVVAIGDTLRCTTAKSRNVVLTVPILWWRFSSKVATKARRCMKGNDSLQKWTDFVKFRKVIHYKSGLVLQSLNNKWWLWIRYMRCDDVDKNHC
jgi:hypothetical protein